MIYERHLAHTIIDEIEDKLREWYPDIEVMATENTDEEGEPVNTLFYGELHYLLEDYITEKLEAFKKEPERRQFIVHNREYWLSKDELMDELGLTSQSEVEKLWKDAVPQ